MIGKENEVSIEKGTAIYAGDLKRSGNSAAVNFRDAAEITPK